MPRSFGKVLPSMWDEDEDFLAMSADAKYVYNFLIGQRDLGHSGIITLRVESWAKRLSKSTPQVKAALRELHVERFIVIDAEELLLLVRSLIRRDEVYKQPNTFKSAVSQIYGCRSQPLRRVLLAELERLEPAEMKGDSEAVRSDVIAWLRKTCENPPPNPNGKGSAKGYESDSGSDAEFGQDFDVSAGEGGSAKGSAIPCGNPQRVHARVDARVAPTPTTTTTTTPLSAPDTLFAVDESAQQTHAGKPRESDEPSAQTFIAEWLDRCPQDDQPTGRIIGRVGKELKALIADKARPEDIRQGLVDWEANGDSPASLPTFVNGARRRRRQAEQGHPQAPSIPAQRPSATTQRTQAGLSLMQEFAAEEGVDISTLLPSNVIPIRRELTA